MLLLTVVEGKFLVSLNFFEIDDILSLSFFRPTCPYLNFFKGNFKAGKCQASMPLAINFLLVCTSEWRMNTNILFALHAYSFFLVFLTSGACSIFIFVQHARTFLYHTTLMCVHRWTLPKRVLQIKGAQNQRFVARHIAVGCYANNIAVKKQIRIVSES